MSQTLLTPVTLKPNNYAVVAGDLAVVPVVMDASNGNSFVATGQEIIFFQNSDASAHTVTVTSVGDQLGRLDTSLTAYSIPANGFAFVQMKALSGWLEPGSLVFLATSSALVKVSILRYQ
jgi:type II secretory pathway component PulF